MSSTFSHDRYASVRRHVSYAALAAAVVVTVCSATATFAQEKVPPGVVLSALRDEIPSLPPTDSLVAPAEPRRLRPCCAFGGSMRVKLIGVPVPWYRHKPLRGPKDIGPHEYDPGVLQILPSPVRSPGADPSREHNGEVYTCRGGFVDTAHARDFADLAWFLAARVASRLDTGGTIDLVDYGGTRRIIVHPVPVEKLQDGGRTSIAIAVAQRLSFELSVWREIATWYGYKSVPPWPEKLSSFSPEDLYSNLLGTKIAGGILRTTAIRSDDDWDRAMTAWMASTLEALGAVPVEGARETMEAVDGVLWNSAYQIPDWRITNRRKFDRGPLVEPWIAHGAAGAAQRATGSKPPDLCGSSDPPQPLGLPEQVGGVSIDSAAEIEVVASRKLLRHGLPLPRPGDRIIREADYDELIDAVRRATEAGLAARKRPSGLCERSTPGCLETTSR